MKATFKTTIEVTVEVESAATTRVGHLQTYGGDIACQLVDHIKEADLDHSKIKINNRSIKAGYTNRQIIF